MRVRTFLVFVVAVTTISSPMAATSATAADVIDTPVKLTVPILPSPRVAPLSMKCTAQQVDLNHASRASLAGALGLDPTYDADVVTSIIGTRPHNGLEDLLLASGMGSGRLDKVDQRSICSTPILNGGSGEVPELNPDYCIPGDGRVDVNADSVDRIAAKLPSKQFPAPQPVAARIVERRDRLPFPNLDHVAVVNGVGPGNLAKIRSTLCLTPAPTVTTTPAGQRYTALIYRDAGVQLTMDTAAGRFGLAVPAGVLDGPAAFATITDVAELTALTPPAADMHIWGPWAGGGDRVYVTTPNRVTNSPSVAATISHLPTGSDLADIATSSNLLTTPTTLTTSVMSLSFMQTVFVPLRIISAPTAEGNTTTFKAYQSAFAKWRDYRTDKDAPLCPADAGDVTNTSDVHGTAIDNEALRHCTFVNDHGQLVVRLAQNRFFVGRGHIDTATGAGAHYGGFGIPSSGTVGAAMQGLSSVFATNGQFFGLVPGGTIDIILEPEQSTVESRIEADKVLTLSYIVADAILEHLGLANAQWSVDCVYGFMLPAENFSRTERATRANSLTKCIADKALMTVEDVFPEVSAALMLTDGGASLVDQMIEQFNSTLGALAKYPQIGASYQVLPDPRPTRDSLGRAVFADCSFLQPFDALKGLWWAIRATCQNSHYDIDPGVGGATTRPAPMLDGTIGAHEVIDNAIYSFSSASTATAYFKTAASTQATGVLRTDYQCMAQRYPVRDWVPTSDTFAWQTSVLVAPALCPLPLTPIRVDASLRNWILRQSDGTAYFLDSAGVTHHFTSGTAYISCAQTHLMLDYRSASEISQFTPGADNVCG